MSCELHEVIHNFSAAGCIPISSVPRVPKSPFLFLSFLLSRGTEAQWEESFFPKTSVAIVILFWLKWAGYLAMAGLNLLAQLSDRISPYGV